jgi:ferritin
MGFEEAVKSVGGEEGFESFEGFANFLNEGGEWERGKEFLEKLGGLVDEEGGKEAVRRIRAELTDWKGALTAFLSAYAEKNGWKSVNPLLDVLHPADFEEFKRSLPEEGEERYVNLRDQVMLYKPKERWTSVFLSLRLAMMSREFWVNEPNEKLGGKSPAELFPLKEGRPKVMSLLSELEECADVRNLHFYLDLLSCPSLDERLDLSFRTGGLLNLFPSEGEEELWKEMREEEGGARKWNFTENPFYNGLKPVEVFFGGGPKEKELLERLLKRFGEITKEEGEAKAKEVWRNFLEEEVEEGKRVRDLVLEERRSLAERRVELCASEESAEERRKKRRKKGRPRRR